MRLSPLDVFHVNRLGSGAQRGDDASWKRLVALYSPLVYGWCRDGGLPAGDAANVLQEVFLAVWQGRNGFPATGRDSPFAVGCELWPATRSPTVSGHAPLVAAPRGHSTPSTDSPRGRVFDWEREWERAAARSGKCSIEHWKRSAPISSRQPGGRFNFQHFRSVLLPKWRAIWG